MHIYGCSHAYVIPQIGVWHCVADIVTHSALMVPSRVCKFPMQWALMLGICIPGETASLSGSWIFSWVYWLDRNVVSPLQNRVRFECSSARGPKDPQHSRLVYSPELMKRRFIPCTYCTLSQKNRISRFQLRMFSLYYFQSKTWLESQFHHHFPPFLPPSDKWIYFFWN